MTLEFIQQALESFRLFLLLQQYRNNNSFKRPWASDHDPGLDVQRGTVEESVNDRLVGFCQHSPEPSLSSLGIVPHPAQ